MKVEGWPDGDARDMVLLHDSLMAFVTRADMVSGNVLETVAEQLEEDWDDADYTTALLIRAAQAFLRAVG